MCLTCRHFKPFQYNDLYRPHHCDFAQAAFGTRELRLDCAEHQPSCDADATPDLDSFHPPGGDCRNRAAGRRGYTGACNRAAPASTGSPATSPRSASTWAAGALVRPPAGAGGRRLSGDSAAAWARRGRAAASTRLRSPAPAAGHVALRRAGHGPEHPLWRALSDDDPESVRGHARCARARARPRPPAHLALAHPAARADQRGVARGGVAVAGGSRSAAARWSCATWAAAPGSTWSPTRSSWAGPALAHIGLRAARWRSREAARDAAARLRPRAARRHDDEDSTWLRACMWAGERGGWPGSSRRWPPSARPRKVGGAVIEPSTRATCRPG